MFDRHHSRCDRLPGHIDEFQMAKKSDSDEAEVQAGDDAALFRQAVAGARPIQHTPRAMHNNRVVPKARFSRAEQRTVLDESLAGDYDEREIDSAQALRFCRAAVGKKTMRKLSRGSFAVQDELDLHGMNVSEAQLALQEFINDAYRRGFGCVRIIHGKGLGSGERGPVLKPKVASLLRRWPPVLAFVSARQVDGGTGAVYVLLDSDVE